MPVWIQVMKRRKSSSQRTSNWPQSCASTEHVCSQPFFWQASFCMKFDVCEHNGGGKCKGGCNVTYQVPCIEGEVRLLKLRVNDWTWNWFNFNKYIQCMLQVTLHHSSSNGRKEWESIPPILQWKSTEQLPGPVKKTVHKIRMQAATRRPIIAVWWDISRTSQRLAQKQKKELLKCAFGKQHPVIVPVRILPILPRHEKHLRDATCCAHKIRVAKVYMYIIVLHPWAISKLSKCKANWNSHWQRMIGHTSRTIVRICQTRNVRSFRHYNFSTCPQVLVAAVRNEVHRNRFNFAFCKSSWNIITTTRL